MNKFEDSTQATEHMLALQAMLQDERVTHWMRVTDANFNTRAVFKLQVARAALEDLLDDLHSAE